jgi:hypothetical protein
MYNKGEEWATHMQDVAWVVKDLCQDCNGIIVEIGAGRGEFAALFNGHNYVAYEPSDDYVFCSEVTESHNTYFDGISMEMDKPDAIIMRHVLEHFASPRSFLEDLSYNAHRCHLTPYLIIEVPNILPAFEAGRLEDWVYEHPQHFTPDSLTTLLDLSGWNTYEVEQLYNDEVLLATASLADTKCPVTTRIALAYDNLLATGAHLNCLETPVFWGGAGKCANTINMLNLKAAMVIDSDSRKWGSYVPGTDFEIHSPETLRDLKPSEIIVTTTWRAADIAAEIKSMGLSITILILVDGLLQRYEESNV